MGGRLKVDLDALADTATELRGLAREFRGAAKTVDGAKSAVGHERVADALNEFSDNWRRHREALVKSLDAVSDMARDSRETYIEVDEDLATQLEEKTK